VIRRAPARFAVAALVLALGGLFYLMRPTDPAAVRWLEHAGLGGLARAVHAVRAAVYHRVPLPGWVRGSFADGCYAFAVGAVFADGARAMLALGLAVALAHEVAQGLGLAAGTFDVADLVVLAVVYVLAVRLFRPGSPRPVEP
jgi:hypothetical protein